MVLAGRATAPGSGGGRRVRALNLRAIQWISRSRTEVETGDVSEKQVRTTERAHHGRGSNARELLLLEKIRLGDDAAFEALYRLYHPRLTNFLIKLVRRPPLVEEVLNDAMMVVWQRPTGFTAAAELSTWISRLPPARH